jgi:hypothetical protein
MVDLRKSLLLLVTFAVSRPSLWRSPQSRPIVPRKPVCHQLFALKV